MFFLMLPTILSVVVPAVVAAVPGLPEIVAANPIASAIVAGLAAVAAALSPSPVKRSGQPKE